MDPVKRLYTPKEAQGAHGTRSLGSSSVDPRQRDCVVDANHEVLAWQQGCGQCNQKHSCYKLGLSNDKVALVSLALVQQVQRERNVKAGAKEEHAKTMVARCV